MSKKTENKQIDKKGEVKPISRYDISCIVGNAFTLSKQPPCKTEEELEQRMAWYFEEYTQTGTLPTWEGLCLACGVDVATGRKYVNGSSGSPRRQELFTRARIVLAEIDAQLVATSHMPVVSYIFRSKNFYGMSDASQVEVTAKTDVVDRAKLIEEAELLPD